MEYDDPQREYVESRFVGVGQGDTLGDAMAAAYEMAWDRAKSAGKAGRPLRVVEEYVWGENPPNWYRVVLGADA